MRDCGQLLRALRIADGHDYLASGCSGLSQQTRSFRARAFQRCGSAHLIPLIWTSGLPSEQTRAKKASLPQFCFWSKSKD